MTKTIARLMFGVVAMMLVASGSSYAHDYCYSHPKKPQCWERHHHHYNENNENHWWDHSHDANWNQAHPNHVDHAYHAENYNHVNNSGYNH